MEVLKLLIPILGICGGLAIPIVVIVLNHQRRMAEIKYGNTKIDQANAPVIDELRLIRQDVSALKERMDTQEIALDDMKGFASEGADFQARLDQVQ